MVANQSVGPFRDHKGLSAALTKLKMDKDKKYALNLVKWKESLKNAFVTFGLSCFLREEFGKQVPPDEVGSILIKDEVAEELGKIKKEYLAKAKEEELLKKVTSAAVKIEESKDESMDGTSEEAPVTAVAMLTTHWADVEKSVTENAEMMFEADKKKRAVAEKRGEHWETLYVNPFTRVSLTTKFLNPRAVVSFGKADPFLYEVEKRETRAQRMMAFIALRDTLKDLPEWVWKHVPAGNVFELYSLIIDNYSDKGREAIVDDLATRLANFLKLKTENFVQFVARFEQLVSEIKEAGMELDRDQLVNSAEGAILKSDDKALKNVYKAWVMQKGAKMSDPFEAFKQMKASMLIEEKESREVARRAKEKDKRKGSGETGRETALRVNTPPDKGSKGTSTGKKNFLGVCHFYQTAKGCSNDECTFEHRKLSAKEAKELKAHIDSRRAEKDKNRAENSPVQRSRRGKNGSKAGNGSKADTGSSDEQQSESAKMTRTELSERTLTADDISRLADELERRKNG